MLKGSGDQGVDILAEKDGINIECVMYNEKDNSILNFPSKIVEDYISGWYLYIKATTQFE